MIGSEVSHDFELGGKEQDLLFLLILIYILCLWLAVPPLERTPPVGRRNTQPEAENVDQNEEEQPITGGPVPEEDVSSSLTANLSLVIAIAHLRNSDVLK